MLCFGRWPHGKKVRLPAVHIPAVWQTLLRGASVEAAACAVLPAPTHSHLLPLSLMVLPQAERHQAGTAPVETAVIALLAACSCASMFRSHRCAGPTSSSKCSTCGRGCPHCRARRRAPRAPIDGAAAPGSEQRSRVRWLLSTSMHMFCQAAGKMTAALGCDQHDSGSRPDALPLHGIAPFD